MKCIKCLQTLYQNGIMFRTINEAHLILSDKCEITWTTIGKFLSKFILEATEEILRASSEVQT